MKASIGSLCQFFNTHRMVGDYMCGHYFKAHEPVPGGGWR